MAAPLNRPMSADRGLRLLVVEDEALISALMEDMLAELGHHVVACVGSIEEAASLASGADFDAALLDVSLGGTTVDAVAETLARRGKPFIFTTGDDRTIPPAFKDRPTLLKPYQIEQLGALLAGLRRPA
jgi:CheY-like chemotaxis protein